MNSPIALSGLDEDEYRNRVRRMSDADLIAEGKNLRWLSGDGKIVSATPCAFYEQLKICREEYRRRHPKS